MIAVPIAKGVDSARAHGQAMISTEVKALSANPGSVRSQKSAARTAMASTAPVK